MRHGAELGHKLKVPMTTVQLQCTWERGILKDPRQWWHPTSEEARRVARALIARLNQSCSGNKEGGTNQPEQGTPPEATTRPTTTFTTIGTSHESYTWQGWLTIKTHLTTRRKETTWSKQVECPCIAIRFEIFCWSYINIMHVKFYMENDVIIKVHFTCTVNWLRKRNLTMHTYRAMVQLKTITKQILLDALNKFSHNMKNIVFRFIRTMFEQLK